MPIEQMKSGGVVITGENSMDYLRALTALQGLKWNKATGGQLTRGLNIAKYVRQHYGLKGKNSAELIPKMESYIAHNWPNARSAQ
jgi:hypothetical protein